VPDRETGSKGEERIRCSFYFYVYFDIRDGLHTVAVRTSLSNIPGGGTPVSVGILR
jgi:hypothetical protein